MKIIKIIIAIYIGFYIIYTPIYIIFFNSAEDAVEKVSIVSSIGALYDLASEMGGGQQIGSLKTAYEKVKKFSNFCENKYGINLATPIYKILKKDKNIKDVRIQFRGVERSGENVYFIIFDRNGKSFQIPVIVRPPSFLTITTAKAFAPEILNLLQLYGLDKKVISENREIFNF